MNGGTEIRPFRIDIELLTNDLATFFRQLR